MSKSKSQLNLWQAWTKHVLDTYASEFRDFCSTLPSPRGCAMLFAKHMMDTRPEEHAEFARAFESTHTSIKKIGKVAKAKMAHGAAGTSEPDIHRIAHELHSLASELESMSGGAHKTRRNQKKRRTTRRR